MEEIRNTNDELYKKQTEFLHSSVEGWWTKNGEIICADDLFCSDELIIRGFCY